MLKLNCRYIGDEFMAYKYLYKTPEGFDDIYLNSDGKYLTGLWFENSKDALKHEQKCTFKDL